MSNLHFTDQMFRFFRNHCSDDLLGCLRFVKLIPSEYSRWDITDYVAAEMDGVSIIDKLNLVWCFLNNDGMVVCKGVDYRRSRQTYLMTALVLDGFVNQQQEADILMPWIDCTKGEPNFDLESLNEELLNQ